MNSAGQITSYPRSKVMALCEELGHDPSRVSNIVIDPGWIRVEYMHPITADQPMNEALPLVDE